MLNRICVLMLAATLLSACSVDADVNRAGEKLKPVKKAQLTGLWKVYKTVEDGEMEVENENVYLNLLPNDSLEVGSDVGSWILTETVNASEFSSVLITVIHHPGNSYTKNNTYKTARTYGIYMEQGGDTEYLVLSELQKDKQVYFYRQK